jgi:hypothetical protein
MTGSDDRTPSPPSQSSTSNAFTRPFLLRFGELDEPPTAGEADVAGPWEVEEIPGFGYGLFPRERGAREFKRFKKKECPERGCSLVIDVLR